MDGHEVVTSDPCPLSLQDVLTVGDIPLWYSPSQGHVFWKRFRNRSPLFCYYVKRNYNAVGVLSFGRLRAVLQVADAMCLLRTLQVGLGVHG